MRILLLDGGEPTRPRRSDPTRSDARFQFVCADQKVDIERSVTQRRIRIGFILRTRFDGGLGICNWCYADGAVDASH